MAEEQDEHTRLLLDAIYRSRAWERYRQRHRLSPEQMADLQNRFVAPPRERRLYPREVIAIVVFATAGVLFVALPLYGSASTIASWLRALFG